LGPLEQPPPSLLINQQFKDLESLNGIFGWDLNWRQIEPGSLKFKITAFGHAEISVMRVEFNRSFHQIGNPPPGAITIGLPDIESGVLKSNGIDTSPGTLINFNHNNLLDTVNQGRFGGFVLSFSEAALRRAFSEIDVDPELVKGVNETRFWGPSDEMHQQLRQILHALRQAAISEGNAGLEKWGLVFNRDLPAITAQILSGDNQQPGLSAPKFQARALKRALHIMSEYDQMSVSVKSLSVLAGASWSTLERAFLNEFGITPKAYSKVRRLTAVQAELIRQGSTATIRDIAGQRGFNHMGSFAADYRKQFGELPSKTLERLADDVT
jgi:AraC family ethanolamine operon transcriptional activator